MMMQKTITTVVEPTVSARVGKDTFLSSPRTSTKNSRIDSISFLSIHFSLWRTVQPPHPRALRLFRHPISGMAGALGFEPRLSVLETDVLPLTPCPYPNVTRDASRKPL